jgi:steroid delta-isomerase-like uncharacterized protein
VVSQKAQDLVRKSFEFFNADDISSLRALYADDCSEQDMATGEQMEGGDAAVQGLLSFKEAFPDLRATVQHLHCAGSTVIAETNFTGTHTAPLEWITGVLAPTNRTLSLDVVQVMETGNGKIRRIRVYYDTGAVTSQLIR